MTPSAANRRGMLAVSVGMAGYTINDTLIKFAARDIPFGEAIFLRGIVTTACLAIVVAASGMLRDVPRARTPLVLWRALFDALGSVLFIAALVQMKIAELSAVVLTAPLMITALAAFVFKDEVGWRRWTAICVGIAGSLFIVKPSPSAFDVWALLGLGAAMFSAGRDTITRQIDPSIPTMVIGLYGAFAVMLGGAAMGAVEQWTVPRLETGFLLAGAGVCLSVASYLLVLGFRDVEISAVAPFRYTLLIWMGLSGYFAFGEVPDRWSLVGSALIALSGLYALHRETLRRKKTREPAADGSVPPA